MRTLRNFFPPVTVWALGFSVLWLLQQPPPDPRQPRETVVQPLMVQESEPVDGEYRSAFFIPEAQDYRAEIDRLSARPLFSNTRRKPESEVIEDIEQSVSEPVVVEEELTLEAPIRPPTPPNAVLRGLLRTHDRTQALVFVYDTDEEIWVSMDDILLGWRVINVSQDVVELEKDGFVHSFVRLP